MKISTRIAILFSCVGLAIFGLYAVYLLSAEENQLQSAVENEIRVLGGGLRPAVEAAFRDGQKADVDEIRKQLHLHPSVFISIHDRHGKERPVRKQETERGKLAEKAAASAVETEAGVLFFDPPDDPSRLVYALPLRTDLPEAGALVIVRELTDVRKDLQVTRLGLFLSASVFVLVSLAAGVLLGHTQFKRPLAKLSRAARQLRLGELPQDLPSDRRDEIGTLARDFIAMSQELSKAKLRLEQEAESRRLLQGAIQQADKLIVIGQLSAGLAHEIGSPLQVLNGRALSALAEPDLSPSVQRNLTIIAEQSDRISRIVEQLLEFTRHRPLRVKPQKMEVLAQNVLDFLEIEARRKKLHFNMEVEGRLPLIEADGDQMQQILLNLLSNAMRESPEGGAITIRLAEDRTETVNGTEPALRVEVCDQGLGIEPSLKERLFEPFFTTHVHEEGTGLGLAVVKSLTDNHQGIVEVADNPAGGTCFIIKLPIRQKNP